jgi:MFS family permease
MLITLLGLTTVVAAVRGLWSPCGLSMLSALNPIAERSRGHRFWLTALWYVAGALAGGAVLGGALAGGAALVAWAALPSALTWALVLAAAAVTLASDLRLGGWQLPDHPRQVDERWLTTYRRWIYAGGFGGQIGAGFATYVMTSAVYLLAALGVLSGRPAVALGAGLLFGAVRGGTIALAGWAQTPARLQALMAGVDARTAASIGAACVAQVAVAAAAAWMLAGPAGGVAAAVVLGAGSAFAGRAGRRTVPAS